MSDYDCYCDYETPEFYNESHPIARKHHECSECGRAIQPGVAYQNISGKWDGRVSIFKRCHQCVSLSKWIKAHVPCFCDPLGGLFEEARELAASYSELWFGITRRMLRAKQQLAAPSGQDQGWG
jgi:hypothetical protein